MKIYPLASSFRHLKTEDFEKGEIVLLTRNNKPVAVALPYEIFLEIQGYIRRAIEG